MNAVSEDFTQYRYLDPMPALEIQPHVGDIMRRIAEAEPNDIDLIGRLSIEACELQESVAVKLRTPEPVGEVSDIFASLVRGENDEAFTTLEHVVNRMRTTGSTGHLCLYGPASAGKTASAQRVARALGREFRFLDAQSLSAPGAEGIVEALKPPSNPRAFLKDLAWQAVLDTELNLIQLVLAPVVLFIDEAHRLPASTQAALLTMMEDPYVLRIPNGALNFMNVCFVLATTDPSRLSEPLRTRTLEVEFSAYSTRTVAEIVSSSIELSPDVAQRIAVASGGVPRRALAIANTLGEDATEENLRVMFGIDEHGLDKTDRRILDILKQHVQLPSPAKIQEAKLLVESHANGRRVAMDVLARACTLLSEMTVPKPLSRKALAHSLGIQDMGDLERRISKLRTMGMVFTTTQGIVLATNTP